MKKLLFNLLIAVVLVTFFQSCEKEFVDKNSTGEIVLKSANTQESKISQQIKNRYIVVFNRRVQNPKAEAENLKSRFGVEPGHIYEKALKGFSAYIPENAINGLKNNPNIAYIEPDITMTAFVQTIPTGISRIQADLNPVAAINSDGGNVDVDVAILDSGVDSDHPDLNVAGGVRFYTITSGPPKSRGSFTDSNYEDDNGHGTHVAGTVAALDNDFGVVGVAPGARIWAVKILDASGSGYLSDIIAGLEWVVDNALTIEVVNMSIGGQGLSNSYQAAIQSVVNAGIVVVVAAGNESMDVYGPDGTFGTNDDIIPAAYPEVAAISALADSDGEPGGLGADTSYDPDDSFASGFSNFSSSVVANNPVQSPGKAIDLMLPGVDIRSTYLDGIYATGSGTSMASPHGAGLAALYIALHGRANNAAGVYTIRQALIDEGVTQRSPEGLAHLNDPDGNEENIGWAGTGSSGGNILPVATFSFTTDGLTVAFTDESYDPDGSITSLKWDFGDGSTSTTQNPSHTYAASGDYDVTLTVTDNENATSSVTKTVTVDEIATGGIVLTATGSKVRGVRYVELNWTDATGTDVIIKVNGSVYGNPTPNDGTETLDFGRTSGTFNFEVCETDGTTCSNTVTVVL